MSVENRRYERASFSIDVTIRRPSDGLRCRGRSIDLSAGGMGIYCERFFAPGEHLRLGITLRTAPTPQSFELDAIVRRAEVQDAGAILGVEFERPLSSAQEPALYGTLLRK